MTLLADLPFFVDEAEAARALRCSPAVLDRLVLAGRLRPVRLLDDGEDTTRRFRPEDLLRLVEESAGIGPASSSEGAHQ